MRLLTAALALLVVMMFLGIKRTDSRYEFESGKVMVSAPQAPAVAQVSAVEPAPAAAKVSAKVPSNTDPRYPSWRLETDWRESENRAFEEAVADARLDLIDYLRTQDPPIEWTPSEAYVRGLLRKGTKVEPKNFTSEDGEKRTKYRCVGTFEMTPAIRADLVHHDRDFRAEDRMGYAGRALAIAVALLLAVTGYLRMDEATKGYYTGWLRLAAFGFIGGAVLILFLTV